MLKPSPTFRSKFEKTVAATMRAAGATYAYEPVKLAYTQPAKARSYTPDFVLGNGIMIECKGVLTREDRQKMLWVRDQHPHLDIRFVFQRASNTLAKNSRTTYGMWADANGFKWSDGTVPRSWMDEPRRL